MCLMNAMIALLFDERCSSRHCRSPRVSATPVPFILVVSSSASAALPLPHNHELTKLHRATYFHLQFGFHHSFPFTRHPQVAKKLVCDSSNLDTYIEAPASSGMKLNLSVPDSGTVIIGLRLLVGHSGAEDWPYRRY